MELSNLEHCRLSLQDMSHFLELRSALINLDAHEHMFCSATQFKAWYELLVGEAEEIVTHKEVLESEELATQTLDDESF